MTLDQVPDEIVKAMVPIFAIFSTFLTLDNMIKIVALACTSLQAVYWILKIVRERKADIDKDGESA